MKKLTILALHLGYGGIENAVSSLANNLCNTYDIEIVSVYKLYDKPAYKLNNKINITYLINSDIAIRVDEYKKILKKGKIIKLFKVLFRDYKLNIFKLIGDTFISIKTLNDKKNLLIEYIKNMKTDIVISTRSEHNILVSKYAKDCKKIAWEHNHGDINYINDVIDSCYNIDSLVLVSKELYNLYKENNKNNKLNLFYVPNVIDSVPSKTSKLDNKKLVSVGRLVEVKGFDDMIDVMKLVHQKDKDVTLEIIGDGDLYGHLNQKIKDNNLDEVITLAGFKDKKYINDSLANSSLFILTSHSESFGIVVIEAMAAGVPTVAFSSAEGLRELINKDNGILIDNRNINDMASKIIELLNDRKQLKAMGKCSYKNSLNYTPNKVYKLWLDVMNGKNE
nr:glycosyltransferase [Bacilli bacterium]